jgi:hypothetical protein
VQHLAGLSCKRELYASLFSPACRISRDDICPSVTFLPNISFEHAGKKGLISEEASYILQVNARTGHLISNPGQKSTSFRGLWGGGGETHHECNGHGFQHSHRGERHFEHLGTQGQGVAGWGLGPALVEDVRLIHQQVLYHLQSPRRYTSGKISPKVLDTLIWSRRLLNYL